MTTYRVATCEHARGYYHSDGGYLWLVGLQRSTDGAVAYRLLTKNELDALLAGTPLAAAA